MFIFTTCYDVPIFGGFSVSVNAPQIFVRGTCGVFATAPGIIRYNEEYEWAVLLSIVLWQKISQNQAYTMDLILCLLSRYKLLEICSFAVRIRSCHPT